METDKGIQPTKDPAQQASLVLSVEEKKRLADFFGVLIQIDRRVHITKAYENKSNK